MSLSIVHFHSDDFDDAPPAAVTDEAVREHLEFAWISLHPRRGDNWNTVQIISERFEITEAEAWEIVGRLVREDMDADYGPGAA